MQYALQEGKKTELCVSMCLPSDSAGNHASVFERFFSAERLVEGVDGLVNLEVEHAKKTV